MSLCSNSPWHLYGLTSNKCVINHLSILPAILTPHKNAISWLKTTLCQICALNMSNQYLQQYVQIQAVALIQEQLLLQ